MTTKQNGENQMKSNNSHNMQNLVDEKRTLFDEAVAHYCLEDAEALYTELRSLYEQLGDQNAVATMASQLGRIHEFYLSPKKAGLFYQEALELYEQLGNLVEAARYMVDAGDIELSQEHDEAATVLYKRAVDSYMQAGALESAKGCLDCVLLWALENGDHTEAEDLFHKMLALLEQIGDKDELNKYRRHLILYLDLHGKAVEATEFLEAILEGCLQEGDHLSVAYFKIGQAILEKRHSRLMNAEDRLQEALDIYTQKNELENMAAMNREIAAIAVRRSDWDKAERLFGESATLYDELASEQGSLISRFLQATVSVHKAETSEAPKFLAQAYFIGVEALLALLPSDTRMWPLELETEGMTVCNAFTMRRFESFPATVLSTFAEDGENTVREQLREIGMTEALIEQMLAPLNRYN